MGENAVEQATEQRARQLLALLDLQQIEQNLYLGQNEGGLPSGPVGQPGQSDQSDQSSQSSQPEQAQRLFGGQVLAQAAMAAYRTVAEVQLHSLHAYFIKAGSTSRPVLYEVERIRDGRSFTTRRVVAIQGGEAIFNMDVSFQIQEPGFDHAQPMPNVPLPEELQDDSLTVQGLFAEHEPSDDLPTNALLANYLLTKEARLERPFEIRSVFAIGSKAWTEERAWNPAWVRFKAPVDPDNYPLAHCLLAYASDMGMVSTASLPHQHAVLRDQLQMASLDHALWIHRPVPIDQWLLVHKRTATAQGSRGMVHADFYALGGELIASMTQEGLLRVRG